VRLLSRYRVALAFLFVPAVATALARWALGDDPIPAEIRELGYGWPALEAGRFWTPLTGAVVSKSLTVAVGPSFTLIGVVLLEHVARHWRTVVVLAGGQVVGVLLALLLTAPLRDGTSAFAVEQTRTVDFGISVGGFACLGAWSGYLPARLRRPLRAAITCYLLCQLLLSGLIFDVSHPVGWVLGVTVGARLVHPEHLDRTPARRPADVWWLAAALAAGTTVGSVAAWHAGGVGGPFGWGP